MKTTLLILSIILSVRGIAQHEHQHVKKDSTGVIKSIDDSTHHHMDMDQSMQMSHAFSLNLPVTRNGSGTGWLPDSTPMYGYMFHSKKWMFMGHGNIFIRYTNQDIFSKGSRGDDKVDAVNWIMLMGQRRVNKNGLLRFSSMFSFDRIFGGDGYPLLFQTGETWQGKPLVDRQHPHDLFTELSIAYSHAFNKKTDAFIYFGYPGEPALGSVAFMHRFSSYYNPDAPLNHHWNDGTHITFGVLTTGVRFGKFKFDASCFTGREPDENRIDFDTPKFDSYSGRITFNPNAYWSFQTSEGFVKSPEVIHPNDNVYRTTASVIYSKPLTSNNSLNISAIWGLNHSDIDEHSALLESVYVIKRFAFYERFEYIQKSTEELNLNETIYDHNTTFNINVISLGMNYDILQTNAGRIAIGAQGSFYSADNRLNTLYGNHPLSGEVFIKLYPPKMFMSKM